MLWELAINLNQKVHFSAQLPTLDKQLILFLLQARQAVMQFKVFKSQALHMTR